MTLSSSPDPGAPPPPSSLKSVCVGDLRIMGPLKIPDKPTKCPGDGKMWKYMPKSNKWVTAPAANPVKTASPALTLASLGSTLVSDELDAFHELNKQKQKPTPPFFTPTTAPGTPKISNVTPSPIVLQDLQGSDPKVTTKAGVTDANPNTDTSPAKDTIMTPSQLKKKQEEDDLSALTTSPSKFASPSTKLPSTVLEDPALDDEDISTFINCGDKTKKKTDDSDRSTDNSEPDADNSVESSKPDADKPKPDADNSVASSKEDAEGQ